MDLFDTYLTAVLNCNAVMHFKSSRWVTWAYMQGRNQLIFFLGGKN